MQLRRLRAADLPAAHALTSSFGWPHRLEDWTLMAELGEGIVAEENGALIGTASAWRFGADRARIGLIGIADAHRDSGIDHQIVAELIAGLGERAIELHATKAGARLYRRLGFEPDGLVREHQGAAFATPLVQLPRGVRLRPIGRSDADPLVALDQAASGADRGTILHAILRTAVGVVLDHERTLIGFALMRRFGLGHVIGPVVAPDPTSARALISHFLAANPGQFMRIDAPEEVALSPWLDGLGLVEVGTVRRMLLGAPPSPAGPVRGFALICQAFG
jgi:N-acetylglutamate synthase-like GNAT family acetyltransferase